MVQPWIPVPAIETPPPLGSLDAGRVGFAPLHGRVRFVPLAAIRQTREMLPAIRGALVGDQVPGRSVEKKLLDAVLSLGCALVMQ
jgi:hypothetical protein